VAPPVEAVEAFFVVLAEGGIFFQETVINVFPFGGVVPVALRGVTVGVNEMGVELVVFQGECEFFAEGDEAFVSGTDPFCSQLDDEVACDVAGKDAAAGLWIWLRAV
jgi:hypothetical protein